MSEEDRELLARISALAGRSARKTANRLETLTTRSGQINRHKNQQAGFQPTQTSRGYHRMLISSPETEFLCLTNSIDQTSQYRGSSYRGSSYRGRYRVTRPTVHRHRTLHLNAQPGSSESSPSTPDATGETSQWVSKTDRHKQLINANIYQQQAQSRAQAIEETRKRKLTQQNSNEKSRFNTFLRHSNSNSNGNQGPSEITIGEIRFLVRDGGKKLVRAAGRLL